MITEKSAIAFSCFESEEDPQQTPFKQNTVFWDVASCSYFVNRRFGGTYRLHLQGRRLQLSVHAGSSLVDCFNPEDGGDTFLPKRQLTKYLHGATSQKTVFFIVIAVKTSNLTF
jgi:hypothetical protein